MGVLDGKVAIVTGATSGIGKGIALRFSREGAGVILGGRDAEKAAAVLDKIELSGGKAEVVLGDVADPSTSRRLVERAIAAFGRLDILVPCAGILGLGSLTEVPLDTWNETMNTNLFSVFHLMRFGIPELKKYEGGAVVVVGSVAVFKGFPNHAAYCVSKGALLPLVRQAALDYGPRIRINMICPGPVDTPLIWDSARAFPVPADAVAQAAQKTALKRLGSPDDIASAAVFLASSEASWITGAAFTVDGGALAGV